MKELMAMVSASILLLGGILAHHVAGNQIATSQSLLGFASLAILLSLILATQELTETRLFFAVFIAQNGAHFLLGSSSQNSLTMFFAHAVTGVISYAAINKGSTILDSLENFLLFLYSIFAPKIEIVGSLNAHKPLWVCIPYFSNSKEFIYSHSQSLRAPPIQ